MSGIDWLLTKPNVESPYYNNSRYRRSSTKRSHGAGMSWKDADAGPCPSSQKRIRGLVCLTRRVSDWPSRGLAFSSANLGLQLQAFPWSCSNLALSTLYCVAFLLWWLASLICPRDLTDERQFHPNIHRAKPYEYGRRRPHNLRHLVQAFAIIISTLR